VPRDLRDVADYFLPRSSEAEPIRGPAQAPAGRVTPAVPRRQRVAALPVLAVPVDERDVVRAALAWNLVVELARLGVGATLLAPAGGETPSPIWPEAGPGPIGSAVVLAPTRTLSELNRAALDVAVARAAEEPDGGVVVACVPPAWLHAACEEQTLLRWALLFSSTDRRDLMESYAIAKRMLGAGENTRVGITIHGARCIADAEHAFHHVADVSQRHLGRSLSSYGLLVDDLHIYRAIVARRPIGIEHPQSRAARALQDVARMILEDARKLAVA